MEPVFRALADPSRRQLLDRLFEEDGQTLGELCRVLPDMTRFGVMRHLAVLENAELITTRRVGRRKLHYLNPVPIRLVHDRWISKYAEPVVGTMAALKHQLEEVPMPTQAPQHVYTTLIRTTPDALWEAIVDGTKTARYYFGTSFATDGELRPGAHHAYRYPDGSVAADGEVLAIEPGRSVTMTFRARWELSLEAEGPVRMTWELTPAGDATKLTVTTSGLRPGSRTAEDFGGGIVFIVSGLKTVVETGEPMTTRGD